MPEKEYFDLSRLYDVMFSRNRLVLNEKNQKRIKHASVAIIGLGGVGSPLCELLVRTGFTDITIIARGTYELGNVNRQIAATFLSVTAKIPKTNAVNMRMLEINPFCRITMLRSDITKSEKRVTNALKKKKVDIVFNCVDEFIAQSSVARIARKINAAMIIGGVIKLGTEGIVTTFKSKGVTYGKLLNVASLLRTTHDKQDIEKRIRDKWLKSNQELMPKELQELYQKKPDEPYPVLTQVPWLLASIMASEAIKLITGLERVNFAPDIIYVNAFKPVLEIKNLGKEERMTDLLVPWRP